MREGGGGRERKREIEETYKINSFRLLSSLVCYCNLDKRNELV